MQPIAALGRPFHDLVIESAPNFWCHPTWPERMPVFEGPAWIEAGGEVWVRRNRPAATPAARYDLFDPQRRLVRQVELPAGRRLVGLGDGTVYTVREGEDGLQWLERYAFRRSGA